MNVAVMFAGYQPSPIEAIKFMDIAMGDSVHTYVSTICHVADGMVTSTHLFVLNGADFWPIRRDGTQFNNPEVIFFATPGVAYDRWRRTTKSVHDRLLLEISHKGLLGAGIDAAEFEDGSLYVINKFNHDVSGLTKLEMDAYSNIVAFGHGEVYSSVPMPIGDRFARMVAVENGRYLDGILFEAARDRDPYRQLAC